MVKWCGIAIMGIAILFFYFNLAKHLHNRTLLALAYLSDRHNEDVPNINPGNPLSACKKNKQLDIVHHATYFH